MTRTGPVSFATTGVVAVSGPMATESILDDTGAGAVEEDGSIDEEEAIGSLLGSCQ
jgi:hypothetical protein